MLHWGALLRLGCEEYVPRRQMPSGVSTRRLTLDYKSAIRDTYTPRPNLDDNGTELTPGHDDMSVTVNTDVVPNVVPASRRTITCLPYHGISALFHGKL